jgi:CheY-like chemotaxis protein
MPTADRTYRLLIVDDDAPDRRLYGTLLGEPARGDFQIAEATNGESGLAALRDGTFDCVLLDFNLPDMTGLEFLTRAAGDDGEQPRAIVLVTGQGNEAVAVEAMKRGAR